MVYAQAAVQTCIVHMIRHSLAHASWKERKALAALLKAVHQAPMEAAAASALDAFEAGPWGRKYPGTGRGWRSVWEQVVPFFASRRRSAGRGPAPCRRRRSGSGERP